MRGAGENKCLEVTKNLAVGTLDLPVLPVAKRGDNMKRGAEKVQ
jgi:hypothetical protein